MKVFYECLNFKKRSMKKIAAAFMLVVSTLAFTLGGIFTLDALKVKADVAGANVIELMSAESGKVFDRNAVNKLYESLTKTSGASFSTVKNAVAGTQKYGTGASAVDIPKIMTSGQIKANNGSDLTVRFGDYKWDVTSLTTTNDGDPIITLYLDTSETLAQNGRVYAGLEDPTQGWVDGGDYSPTGSPHPRYMSVGYGTSHMRAITLNVGGKWVTSPTSLSTSTWAQQTDNPYAKYTMGGVEGSLIEYIATPSQVKYQEIESQFVQFTDADGYSFKNDAYGIPVTERWPDGHNMTDIYINRSVDSEYKESEYTGWQYDYVWLPSLTETGATSGVTGKGIWDLSAEQQTNNGNGYAGRTWLRSSLISQDSASLGRYFVCLLDSDGRLFKSTGPNAARPALHLNLASVEAELNKFDLMASSGSDEFSEAAINTLYSKLTGKAGAKYADVVKALEGTEKYGTADIPSILTAKDIKSNSGYDLKVKFGDYYWDITSLTTTRGGDPIATLYLDTSNLVPGSTTEKLAAQTSVFAADQSGTGWSNNDANPTYMSNGYGTSYVRVKTLNAGGQWAISTSALSTAYARNVSNPYARYTMASAPNSLTKYISTPAQVKYQEIENTFVTIPSWNPFTIKNEAYGIPEGEHWSDGQNMTDKYIGKPGETYYTCWQSDYLWLPSLTETGAGNILQDTGIWALSTAQRSNPASSTYTWLRSGYGHSFFDSPLLSASGSTYGRGVSGSNAVRPALHLNLASIESEFHKLDLMSTQSGKVFDSTALTTLYERLTGKTGATIADVKAAVAGTQKYGNDEIPTVVTSAEIREKNPGKYNLNVKFGDYYWDVTSLTATNDGSPILTLYLDPTQNLAKNTSPFAADASGNGRIDGYETANTYLPAIYGTSYIRAKALNAGGKWATGASTAQQCAQDTANPYARYTMTIEAGVGNSLTDYIATPAQVKYQQIENIMVDIPGFSDYCYKNDSYGTPEQGAWSQDYDMTERIGTDDYSGCKNDYLWLPSLGETGSENIVESGGGIWGLSSEQRMNSAEYAYTWLRTGARHNNNNSAILDTSGNFSYISDNYNIAVRPALHLDLGRAACEVNGSHTEGTWTTDKDATCTETGTKHTNCTICGERIDGVVELKPHEATLVDRVEATCMATGNVAHYLCGKCNKTFSDQACTAEIRDVTIPIDEDAHKWDEKWQQSETQHWQVCTLNTSHISEKVNHSFGDWTITTTATCSAKGEREHSCTVCEYKATEEIEIDGTKHNLKSVAAVAETCDKDGTKAHYECEDCHKKFLSESDATEATDEQLKIPAAHKLEEVAATTATCIKPGNSKYYKCSVCGKMFDKNDGTGRELTEDDIVTTAPHEANETAAKAATCTENGNIQYWQCSVCNKYFKNSTCTTEITQEETVIPAAHTLTHAEAKDKTCTEAGNVEYWHCTVCDKYYLDGECTDETTQAGTVIAASHTLTHHALQDSTCVAAGKKEHWSCSVCGKFFTDSAAGNEVEESLLEIEVKPHAWSDWSTTKQETCTSDGEEERTCSVCKQKETNIIAGKGHDLSGAWQQNKNGHWHVCANGCGERPDFHEHIWGEPVISREPTDTEPGEATKTCTECSYSVAEPTFNIENAITSLTIANWAYGDEPSAPQATATYGGDNLYYLYADSEFGDFTETVPAAVGEYWVKAVVDANVSGYYPGAEKKLKFEIVKRQIEVAINGASSEAGKPLEALTATVSIGSLAEGDEASDVYKLTTDANISVLGEYKITGECVNDNYEITFIEGVYIISRRTSASDVGDEPTVPGEIDLPNPAEIVFHVSQSQTHSDYDAVEGLKGGYNVGYWAQLWYRMDNGTLDDTPYDGNLNCILTLKIPQEIIDEIRRGGEISRTTIEQGLKLYSVSADGAASQIKGYNVLHNADDSWSVKFNYNGRFSAEIVFNTEKHAQPGAGIPWWVWLLVGIGAALIIAAVVVIIVVVKKKNAAKYDDAELKAQLAKQNKRIEDLENRDDGGFNDVYKGE